MAEFQERDPAEVRRELRWRRAAAALLLHRIEDDPVGEAAAMEQVEAECRAYGVTPGEVLISSLMDLVGWYVRDAVTREGLIAGLRDELLLYYGVSGPDQVGGVS